jgi:hypothetical protein
MLDILDPIVEKTEKEFIQILSSHEKNEIGILLKKIIKTNN